MDSLGLTFDYLATTENEAATALLLSALEHRDRTVSDGAVSALLRRKAPEALDQLVARWHTMSDRWKQCAANRPGVLTSSLRTAFHSPDDQLIKNAADAAVMVCDYDLISTFAAAASDVYPLRRRLAAESVLRLAELLYEELHGGAFKSKARRDPQCVRDFVVGSLESPVARFNDHHSREVLEAFLLVAPRESATLRHLLQDAHEPSHQPLCDQLLRSTRPGVIRLLLSMIDDPHAPLAALRIIGKRRDVGFLRQLCRKLVDDHSPHLDANLSRIDSLAWIDDGAAVLASLAEVEQRGAVLLVARSKVPDKQKRRVLREFLSAGLPLGREAAAKSLVEILDEDVDLLLRELVEDECPLVQAVAALHLRECDIPDALNTLIDLLESPHEVVRNAARQALDEFSLARYLSAFDTLSKEARRSTGLLVKQVNPDLPRELVAEMCQPGRPRRLRAMEAAAVLGVVPLVEEGLLKLCDDESHAVRLEAARLLGQCSGQEVRRALRELLRDPSTAVQHMAEQSLQEVSKRDPRGTTIVDPRQLPAPGVTEAAP